jgi:hypothetical protein
MLSIFWGRVMIFIERKIDLVKKENTLLLRLLKEENCLITLPQEEDFLSHLLDITLNNLWMVSAMSTVVRLLIEI